MYASTYNLYPEIEPFSKSSLKVSDLHEIYYEECGNPAGAPVVFLHGGPGSGCNPTQRRFFDPTHYRLCCHALRLAACYGHNHVDLTK